MQQIQVKNFELRSLQKHRQKHIPEQKHISPAHHQQTTDRTVSGHELVSVGPTGLLIHGGD